METNFSRSRNKRRRGGVGLLAFVFVIGAALAAGWLVYTKNLPSKEQIDPAYQSAQPIMMEGAETAYGALIEQGEVKLPLPFLEELLGEDKPIHYEAESNTLVLTTAHQVLRLKTDALTGMMNQQPYSLNVAAEVSDDIVYIPSSILNKLFGLQIEYSAASGIVTVLEQDDAVQRAEVVDEEGAALRSGPSIHEPYLIMLDWGEQVRIWGEQDGWLLVQSGEGHPGFMNKKDLKLTEVERVPSADKQTPFIPWKVMGQKINMTWEAVYERRIDPSNIGDMPGLNVVSPTWFELEDDKGTIRGKADTAYVKWAHEQGYQVWALFSNAFEPDRTTIALSTVESRFHMIQQLIGFAELYNLQGINIDFENVYTKDKENLVQFVKEMTPLLHEQGLVVSIDVTPKSNSEMWSVFLDRPALGKVVDYMMVMAYDEHWAASPKSGSVASLPWTERSITRILEEDGVPASKLVLSMPLYTRIWTEKPNDDGSVSVSSKAVGMERVKQIVAEKKLEPVFDEEAGQNYVEYAEDGALQRIWIEDDVSMKARTELVRKYDLAGVATWARSFQTPSIWETIHEGLSKKP